jgi:hypothetical protein
MPRVYDVGDDVTATGVFTDADGDPVDPSEVRLEVIDPLGVETDSVFSPASGPISISNPTVGTFVGLIPATMAGIWQYRFRAPGTPGKGAASRIFTVRRSDFV